MTETTLKKIPLDELCTFLISPDSGKPLHRRGDELTDGANAYPILDGSPILYPSRLIKYYRQRLAIPLELFADQDLQYFIISQMKMNAGAVNDDFDDPWNQQYLSWCRDMLSGSSGNVIDIGCDDPKIAAFMVPGNCAYVGVDALTHIGGGGKVVAFGEHLPFRDRAFDNVMLLSCLDHMLDWSAGLQQALRILKKDGTFHFTILVWDSAAELTRDVVHFHHFRESQILNALSELGLKVRDRQYRPWKNSTHRRVMLLQAGF